MVSQMRLRIKREHRCKTETVPAAVISNNSLCVYTTVYQNGKVQRWRKSEDLPITSDIRIFGKKDFGWSSADYSFRFTFSGVCGALTEKNEVKVADHPFAFAYGRLGAV